MSEMPLLPEAVLHDLRSMLQQAKVLGNSGSLTAETRRTVMERVQALLGADGIDPNARLQWTNAMYSAMSDAPKEKAHGTVPERPLASGVLSEIVRWCEAPGDDPVHAIHRLCDLIDDERGRLAEDLRLTTTEIDMFTAWLRASVAGDDCALPDPNVLNAFDQAFRMISGISGAAYVRWGFDGTTFRRIYVSRHNAARTLRDTPLRTWEGFELWLVPEGTDTTWQELHEANTQGRTRGITSVYTQGAHLEHMTADAGRVFAEAIRNVSTLSLSDADVSMIPPDVLALIAGTVRPATLLCSNCNLHLLTNIDHENMGPMLAAVRSIDLSINHLWDMGEVQIASFMSRLTNLRKADLCDNAIGGMTANELAALEPALRGLTHLDIQGNGIDEMPEPHLRMLAEMLPNVQGSTGEAALDEAIRLRRERE